MYVSRGEQLHLVGQGRLAEEALFGLMCEGVSSS